MTALNRWWLGWTKRYGALLAVGTALGGCGGGNPAPKVARHTAGKQAASPRKASASGDDQRARPCSVAERRGTYQVKVHPFSSTCPPVPDYVEQLDGKAPPLGEHCGFDTPDHWSKDGCTLERAFTCRDEAGGTSKTVVTSSQKEDDGSLISGMMSLSKYDRTGSPICQGTYSFIATRE